MAKRKSKIPGICVLGVLTVTAIVFSSVVGANYQKLAIDNGTITVKNVDRAYTLSEGTSASTNIEAEGATLLVNKDNTLPLNDRKVTVLGARSFNYVQGGTGSAGGRDDSNTAMLNIALGNEGVNYNKEAWDWLSNALGAGDNIHNAGAPDANYIAAGDNLTNFNDWTNYQKVAEFSKSTYDQFVTSIIGEYSDTAIVTFGRSGAEGASPSLDYDGNRDTTTGRVYLELTDEEKDLLIYCKEHFQKTVVLVNSAEPMECGFAENDDYNVGAVLWIGHPGEAGMYGVAQILKGTVSPSGHTVDTWSYDMSTNPTFYSADDQTYSNVTLQSKNKYYQYNEGIYVGYRYYETADAEGYFDSNEFKATKFKGSLAEGKYYSEVTATNSYEAQKVAGPQATYNGYGEVVQFPFGYGLSYTTFTQTVKNSDVKLAQGGENSITVTVKNTGEVKGRTTVQLYCESPYAQDSSLGISGVGLEKPKVELIAFAKTEELEPGASQDVTISFSTDDCATFDEFGEGAYVLEKGTYKFHISPNAHGWADEEAYGKDYAVVEKELSNTISYKETKRKTTRNGVTVEEGAIARNAMNDVTAGDGSMLINGGASGTYKYGYLSRHSFYDGMKEIMSYQSDDYTGKYSGNGFVWSADGTGTTIASTGIGGKRAAAAAVKTAIETKPADLTTDGVNKGMDYNYQSILADGITFGDGNTQKKLYGYGNDQAINMEYTRDGKTQDDASYETCNGIKVEWEKTYYVALDSNNETVKADDGYVAVFDTETEAAAKGTATKLQCEHMAGVPSGDVRWDKLANELSFAEADILMGENGWHCREADSVGKVFGLAVDGPGEAGNAQNADCTWWPCACIVAATWNGDRANDYGVAYGHQDLLNNTPYCYAPAMNTHRTPFGGRDFEYYSEDGVLAGIIGGNAVAGLQSTGMHVFIKHFVLNDSDTNRGGVETWTDEASVRSIYNRPYEIACKFFDADGMMGSLNSIGMAWGHAGLYQNIVREEWNWNGFLITDGDGSNSDAYNNYDFWTFCNQGGILGGGTLSNNKTYTTIATDGSNATKYQNYMLHKIGMNTLYQYSHNIDKLNAITTTNPNYAMPTTLLIVVDSILVVGILITAFVTFKPRKVKKAATAE